MSEEMKRGPGRPRRVIAQDDDLHAVHTSRDQEYPSDEAIHDDLDADDWSPPGLLDAPPPRPGFVQRWVRVKRGAQDDVKNWMRSTREGWTPRDPKTVPAEIRPPTIAHGTFGNTIMVEGMILCEMPVRRNQQRRAYFNKKIAAQNQAINADLLKVQAPGYPIAVDARTQVTRGTGRRPQVQADEDAA